MSDEQKHDDKSCQKCGVALPVRHPGKRYEAYFFCDIDGGPFCGSCFEKHPCGREEHGEGCPTAVHAP